MKPLWYRWARVYFAGGCIIGSGFLLFKYTVPTDEAVYESFSPEIKQECDAKRRFRQLEQEELIRIVRKTSALNDPIWKTGPIGLPFEKNQRNLGQRLIDYNEVEKQDLEESKRSEVERAQQEMQEIVKLDEKRRWKWW